jgi:hypothetical protein
MPDGRLITSVQLHEIAENCPRWFLKMVYLNSIVLVFFCFFFETCKAIHRPVYNIAHFPRRFRQCYSSVRIVLWHLFGPLWRPRGEEELV